MPIYKVTTTRLVMAANQSHAKAVAQQQDNPYDSVAEIITGLDQVPADWLDCTAYTADGAGSQETVGAMFGAAKPAARHEDAHLEAAYEDAVSGGCDE